jgi:hypothetical protein
MIQRVGMGATPLHASVRVVGPTPGPPAADLPAPPPSSARPVRARLARLRAARRAGAGPARAAARARADHDRDQEDADEDKGRRVRRAAAQLEAQLDVAVGALAQHPATLAGAGAVLLLEGLPHMAPSAAQWAAVRRVVRRHRASVPLVVLGTAPPRHTRALAAHRIRTATRSR